VLRDHALVLDGHLPAGEGHHPRSRLDVAAVERRPQQGLPVGRHRSTLTTGESTRPRRTGASDRVS
jgi:hypothetical protein